MSNQQKSSVDSPEGRNYAYEITQKLTYYIVTAELIFCGYLLLNADKLIHFKAASCIFLIAGMAALFGLLWRFCYNITYHAHSHAEQCKLNGYFDSFGYKTTRFLQPYLHNMFAIVSSVTLIWGVWSGYIYIRDYKLLQTEHTETLAVKSPRVVKSPLVVKSAEVMKDKVKPLPSEEDKPKPPPLKAK